jgi:hypothetical protein
VIIHRVRFAGEAFFIPVSPWIQDVPASFRIKGEGATRAGVSHRRGLLPPVLLQTAELRRWCVGYLIGWALLAGVVLLLWVVVRVAGGEREQPRASCEVDGCAGGKAPGRP